MSSELIQAAIKREHGTHFTLAADEVKQEVKEEEVEVTKVWMVILATSFGRTIARDIVAAGGRTHLVQSVPGQPQHVTKPLIEIHMVPVINYWLQQLRKTPRLLPIEKKLWIVCNDSNYDEARFSLAFLLPPMTPFHFQKKWSLPAPRCPPPL